MKRILLGFSLLLSLSLSAQSWQSKPVVRIEDAGQSFLYTFSDSSDAYINKCNVSYIVNLPNSQWVQLGYMYDGSTSRIITASYSAITQPDLASAKILSDTLNAWLVDCAVVVGDSTLQTLSIYGDTLSISDGNSVILPVYVQVDSAVITSYDVLNSQNAPPVSPATGDIYLVGNSPSGAWVGHAKDIAEWNGSGWVFTDGVQGDFLYNATNALTYIFRSGNWVQTTGIPALNNGNTISSGLRIGTNNARSLTFETNNVNRGGFDSVGRFYVYDTSLRKSNKYLQIDSITGRLVASEISGGGGGGAGSISALTAATATNNIFNTNYKQRWSWNTLAGDTALVIASNSVNATSNLQNLLTVSQSGANGTSTQTTYGAIFSNKKTGTSSTNIAGRFVASGATNNIAIEAESQVRINNPSTSTRYLSFWSGTTENARIGNLNLGGAMASDNLLIANTCGLSIAFNTGTSGNGTERMRIRPGGTLAIGYTGYDYAALEIAGGSFGNAIYVADAKGILMNGGSILLNGGTFKSNLNTNFGADGSDNMFFQVAGSSKMIIANANGVSIGANTTPASSAILDVVSVTKGFLPPRMTTTQRDAISSPATGLTLFCTDCTATDASTGVMQTYNGATWKNFW